MRCVWEVIQDVQASVFFTVISCCFQGGRPGVPTKEEGICQMPRKSRRRARKPKQDSDWGAQSAKRHLSTQSRVIPVPRGRAATVCVWTVSVYFCEGVLRTLEVLLLLTHARKCTQTHTRTKHPLSLLLDVFTRWCQCFWLWIIHAPPPAKQKKNKKPVAGRGYYQRALEGGLCRFEQGGFQRTQEEKDGTYGAPWDSLRFSEDQKLRAEAAAPQTAPTTIKY